jgi:hypothetical protein
MSNTNTIEKCDKIEGPWGDLVRQAEDDLRDAKYQVKKLNEAIRQLRASAHRGDPLPPQPTNA